MPPSKGLLSSRSAALVSLGILVGLGAASLLNRLSRPDARHPLVRRRHPDGHSRASGCSVSWPCVAQHCRPTERVPAAAQAATRWPGPRGGRRRRRVGWRLQLDNSSRAGVPANLPLPSTPLQVGGCQQKLVMQAASSLGGGPGTHRAGAPPAAGPSGAEPPPAGQASCADESAVLAAIAQGRWRVMPDDRRCVLLVRGTVPGGGGSCAHQWR